MISVDAFNLTNECERPGRDSVFRAADGELFELGMMSLEKTKMKLLKDESFVSFGADPQPLCFLPTSSTEYTAE